MLFRSDIPPSYTMSSVWMLYWTLYMKEVYLYRWRADCRLIGPCYSTVKSFLSVVKPDCSLTDIRIHTGHSASYRYVYVYLMRTPAWVA